MFAEEYVFAKIYSIQNDLRFQAKVIDFCEIVPAALQKVNCTPLKVQAEENFFFRRKANNLFSQIAQEFFDWSAEVFRQGCQN